MLSIVMPAYNEAEIIEASVREWHDKVAAKLPGTELIVVDDASSDATADILESLEQELPGLRLIRSPINRGHGPSVRAGLLAARGDFVFQTDSDRQHLPEEFLLLWDRREEADFVFGVRKSREDGTFRIAVTFFMRSLMFALWGRWLRDANCPYKLMRREPMRKILDLIPEDSFIPMVHLAILSRKTGMRVIEVPVTHLPRRGGTPSLKGLARWGRVGLRCVGEMASLRLRRLSD